MKAFLFLAAILAACGTCEACRLLVSVDSKVAFSAEEFAKASGAAFIQVDSRNPYLFFHDCFLETPYVVIEKNVNDQVLPRRLAVRYGYRYQDISEGSLEEAIFQAEQKLSSTPKHPSEIDSLSDAEQNRLYALMGKIDTVLTKAGIQYWAGRQTLLGALYYQGLRPWDDYLHLFMLEAEDEKLKELQSEFDKAGLVLHHYWKDFYKIF